jgi:hypothetical protein
MMLEYMKNVLKRVSFDQQLFYKEFKKSKKWLNHHEILELESWVEQHLIKYNLNFKHTSI